MPLSPEDFPCHDDNRLFQLIKTQQWDAVVQLLDTTEGTNMVRECDIYGNTPLHSAIGFHAPEQTILKPLLEKFPEATRYHGSNDWLPLHIAAMWGSSATIIECLIRLYPQALDDKGESGIKGRTPRHFACRFPDERRQLLERTTDEWIAIIENEQTL